MAVLLIFLTSVTGSIVSLLSLVMFGATWGQAIALYLVIATVPTAIALVGMYLYMLVSRETDAGAEPQRARIS